MEMNFDNALGSDFNKDHPEAFARLYRFYYAALCAFAQKYLGDADDARDLVSALFERLLTNKVELNAERNIKSYLYTAVRNDSLNYLKKKSRDDQKADDLHRLLLDDQHFYGEVLESEVVEEIYTEIEGLPPKCREIFKLLYIEEMSYAAVAEHLQLTEQTVRNQKALAIKKLKRRLFPDELFVAAVTVFSVATLLGVVFWLAFFCLG